MTSKSPLKQGSGTKATNRCQDANTHCGAWSLEGHPQPGIKGAWVWAPGLLPGGGESDISIKDLRQRKVRTQMGAPPTNPLSGASWSRMTRADQIDEFTLILLRASRWPRILLIWEMGRIIYRVGLQRQSPI